MNKLVSVWLSLSMWVPVAGFGSVEAPSGPVSWLSTGDSYSSGEGVFGNEGACAQSESAWGPAAAGLTGWEVTPKGFTACTGHLVEDFFNPREDGGQSLYEWGVIKQGVPERVDVMTMSFGGNDIGFPDVMAECLLPDSWIGLAPVVLGCEVSELEIQQRIDALMEPTLNIGSTVGIGSYVDFLVKVARDHLTPRGRLVLAGYPQLFAPTAEWPVWSYVQCFGTGITRGDADKLGRLAVYFDAKLKSAVSQANQQLGTDRIIYLSTRDLYRDGSHELCGTGADWLNGITTTRGEGSTFRWQGSFHPNVNGHANTGQAAAASIELGATTEVVGQVTVPEEPAIIRSWSFDFRNSDGSTGHVEYRSLLAEPVAVGDTTLAVPTPCNGISLDPQRDAVVALVEQVVTNTTTGFDLKQTNVVSLHYLGETGMPGFTPPDDTAPALTWNDVLISVTDGDCLDPAESPSGRAGGNVRVWTLDPGASLVSRGMMVIRGYYGPSYPGGLGSLVLDGVAVTAAGPRISYRHDTFNLPDGLSCGFGWGWCFPIYSTAGGPAG